MTTDFIEQLKGKDPEVDSFLEDIPAEYLPRYMPFVKLLGATLLPFPEFENYQAQLLESFELVHEKKPAEEILNNRIEVVQQALQELDVSLSALAEHLFATLTEYSTSVGLSEYEFEYPEELEPEFAQVCEAANQALKLIKDYYVPFYFNKVILDASIANPEEKIEKLTVPNSVEIIVYFWQWLYDRSIKHGVDDTYELVSVGYTLGRFKEYSKARIEGLKYLAKAGEEAQDWEKLKEKMRKTATSFLEKLDEMNF